MCSRSSDSNRTPTANVAELKRSKASAVQERGVYGSELKKDAEDGTTF
jgi:hypothetical protein